MIKVNLSKVASSSAGAGLGEDAFGMAVHGVDQETRKQAIIRGMIFLMGSVMLWAYGNMVAIPDKRILLQNQTSKLNEMTEKNNAAASAVAEMKSFETDESKLKDQIAVIDNLRRDRLREVKILDIVQRDMPEHMWLTKIDLSAGKMRIEGMAGSSTERNQMLELLTKSNLVKEITGLKTNEEMLEGTKVEAFSFDCIFPSNEVPPPGKT